MRNDEILFEAKALIGQKELPIETYCELQVGDIVILDQKMGDPFEIQVEGDMRFKGAIGLYGTRKAVKIL